MADGIRVIQTTLPGKWIEPEVGEFCQSILDAGAACVQHSAISSMYKWEGAVQSEPEWRIQIKVSHSNSKAVIEQINRLHPYETPQIIAWDADANEAYKSWIHSF